MNTHSNKSHATQDRRAGDTPDAAKANSDGAHDKDIGPTPTGMDAAARQAREAGERFSRTLGFSGEEGERLALKSKKNMDAVGECGSVLTKAFQASSESWIELVQGQWKRSFDGMQRLIQAKSVQEFGTIQGELVRENLEHILKDSRSIAERSMRAADDAGKTLSSITDKGAHQPA